MGCEPAADYNGQFIVYLQQNSSTMDHELWIQIADPHVMLTSELVDQISLETETEHATYASIQDGVLTIKAVNRTVKYKISDKVGTMYPADLIEEEDN